MKSRKNKLRTKLLLLANDDINRIKKTSHTQINSRGLREFEKFYADLNNNNAIALKEEKFVSRDFTDIIQQNNKKEKFILKSPDDNSFIKFNDNTKQNTLEAVAADFFMNQKDNRDYKNIFKEKKLLFFGKFGSEEYNTTFSAEEFDFLKKIVPVERKKSLISSKKNLFFRMNTLVNHNNASESESESIIIANAHNKSIFL